VCFVWEVGRFLLPGAWLDSGGRRHFPFSPFLAYFQTTPCSKKLCSSSHGPPTRNESPGLLPAQVCDLHKQRPSWLLLVYSARVYQLAQISVATGMYVLSYLLCETATPNLSAWELVIFHPLAFPVLLAFKW